MANTIIHPEDSYSVSKRLCKFEKSYKIPFIKPIGDIMAPNKLLILLSDF